MCLMEQTQLLVPYIPGMFIDIPYKGIGGRNEMITTILWIVVVAGETIDNIEKLLQLFHFRLLLQPFLGVVVVGDGVGGDHGTIFTIVTTHNVTILVDSLLLLLLLYLLLIGPPYLPNPSGQSGIFGFVESCLDPDVSIRVAKGLQLPNPILP